MASITSILKRARTSGGWGGWSGLSGVDYVNDSGLYVVYGIGLSMSAGEVLNSVQVSTNFVAPQTSSNPSTVTCYLYASDPTGYASPPGGMIASSSQSFNASAAGNYITFSFSGLGLSATTMVYAWFVCSTTYTSYGSNQIYHYSTGNGYTYTPTAYVGASGGSSGGGWGDSGDTGIITPLPPSINVGVLNSDDAGIVSIGGISAWYFYGDTATMSIQLEDNYNFLGWYRIANYSYGLDESEYEFEFLSSASSFSFTVTEDTVLYVEIERVPRPIRKLTIIRSSNNVAKVSINGVSYTDKEFELQFEEGTAITAGYSGARDTDGVTALAVGWQDINGNVLEQESGYGYIYEFTLIEDTTLIASALRGVLRFSLYLRNTTGISACECTGDGITQESGGGYRTSMTGRMYFMKATPAQGYKFDYWYTIDADTNEEICISTNNPGVLETSTVTFNYLSYSSTGSYYGLTVYAKAIGPYYTITTEAGEGVKFVSGDGEFLTGESCTLSAEAAYGYNFSGWYKGSTRVSTSNPYNFVVSSSSPGIYKAVATPKTYKITIRNNVEGTVNTYSCQFNTSFTAQATVRAGYEFAGWSVDGTIVSTQNPCTITVTGDMSLVAVINPIIYTITPVAGEGIASVSGGGNYPHGSSCTISAVPAERYRFTGWKHGSVIRYTTNPATVDVNYSIFGSNKSVVLEAYGYLAYLIANNVWVWNNGGWQKVTPFVWIENAWKKIKTIIFRG